MLEGRDTRPVRPGWHFPAMFAALVLASAACDRRPDAEPGAGSADPARATPAAPAEAPRVLDARFQQDADGNAVPDFIEREIGYDPARDDCPLDGPCGDGAGGEALDLSVNTLLLLDASGSMAARVGGATKLEVAKGSLQRFVSGVPRAVRVGFLAYGHTGDNTPAGRDVSCRTGVELLARIGEVNRGSFPSVLARFEPRGWTPIAAALLRAREAFAGLEGRRNRIVMVSDGLETCGGDPVAVARQLASEGLKVQVDVIGFGVTSEDARQLRGIAEAGGGTYFDARTQAELDDYFRRLNDAFVQTMGAANCEHARSNEAWSCEIELTNRATQRLGVIRDSMYGHLDRAAVSRLQSEVIELRTRIEAWRQQRIAARKHIRERADQLARDAYRVNEQALDAHEQIKSPGAAP